MTEHAADRSAGRATDYSAPALDKALDILELLAGEAGGLTQTEIAEAVGRNVSQIYRVLATLERRGYLTRDGSGRYVLSMALFDLAHRHPPLRGLVQLAAGPMRALADEIRQSCNLSVDDAGAVRVIAQAESPADFGYQVRVGARFPLESTATGAVLSLGSTDAAAAEPAAVMPGDAEQLAAGYLTRPDRLQAGITDVVVAITDRKGDTVAALTVPYIGTSYSAVELDDVVAAARATAAEISARLGGR